MKTLIDDLNNPITALPTDKIDLLFLVLENLEFNHKKARNEDFFSLQCVGIFNENRLKQYKQKAEAINNDYALNGILTYRVSVYRIFQQTFNFKKAIRL